MQLYQHSKSSKTFRSITEVVKFLLYEIYPDYNKKENMQIPEEDLVSDSCIMYMVSILSEIQ